MKLIKENQMTEFGFLAINLAKSLGKWDVKITNLENFTDMFTEILKNYPTALKHYLNMSNSVKKNYANFYFTAKNNDTKDRRLIVIVERLNQNLKPM